MPCHKCWRLGDRGSHLRLSLQRITELTSKTPAWTLLLIAQARPVPQDSTTSFCCPNRETRRGKPKGNHSCRYGSQCLLCLSHRGIAQSDSLPACVSVLNQTFYLRALPIMVDLVRFARSTASLCRWLCIWSATTMHAPVFGHQGKKVVKRSVMLATASTTTLGLDFCPRAPSSTKKVKGEGASCSG